jgi:hypothetical protein
MKECKTGYMLLAALFTISTLWSKTRCISTDESIKKISCTCIDSREFFYHKEE